jgi:hypothetical protein
MRSDIDLMPCESPARRSAAIFIHDASFAGSTSIGSSRVTQPWDTIVAVAVLLLAMAAELNLMRIFLSDWIHGRQEHGALKRDSNSREFVLGFATIVLFTWVGSQARGQDSSPDPSAKLPIAQAPDLKGEQSDEGASEQPARRALPSPYNSPPFPGSEYLGPTIGVPNSTPDYGLMHALKDTAFGKWQKDNRIDIYGWINTSWNWSTSKNSNLPNVYDIVPNRVELNQAVLRFERNPDTVQVDHLDWGFRVTNLYGTDYRFTVAKGWFDRQLLEHNDLYGYDLPELYGLVYVPDVAQGMVV